MKQELTITIDVPEGKKAYWDGNKVAFVDDEITELPKSGKISAKNHPVQKGEAYIIGYSVISEFPREKSRSKFNKNALPDKASAKQHLALMQLH